MSPNAGFNAATEQSDEWETPPWLFRALDAEFGFTLDPCATVATAKCRHFLTKLDDGLCLSWGGHNVFVNPPYSDVEAWVGKAISEMSSIRVTVLLLPVRTDSKWFSWLRQLKRCGKAEIRFLRKRVRFLLDGKEQTSPRFASMVVVL